METTLTEATKAGLSAAVFSLAKEYSKEVDEDLEKIGAKRAEVKAHKAKIYKQGFDYMKVRNFFILFFLNILGVVEILHFYIKVITYQCYCGPSGGEDEQL